MEAGRIAEFLRYEIARGTYPPGDRLPSIRALARRLGVSPHRVGAAYRILAREGWIALHVGRGATVLRQQQALSKAERLEQGARILEEALRRLIPLGLSAPDILHLLEEQLTYESPTQPPPRVLFAAPGREEAQLGAEALLLASGWAGPIYPVRIEELSAYRQASRIFCFLSDLSLLRAEGCEQLVGLPFTFPRTVLEAVAELSAEQSLGLVTQESETLTRYTERLRSWTGFRGTVVGLLRDHEALGTLVATCDLVLYTPACLRQLRPHLGQRPALLIRPELFGWSPGELQTLLGSS